MILYQYLSPRDGTAAKSQHSEDSIQQALDSATIWVIETNSICNYCSFTNSAAIPIPVPMHILVNSIFFFCRLHSLSPETICLTPVMPNGCPRAIAPPRGFSCSQSMLSLSRQYTAIDAKASLISMMSTSLCKSRLYLKALSVDCGFNLHDYVLTSPLALGSHRLVRFP